MQSHKVHNLSPRIRKAAQSKIQAEKVSKRLHTYAFIAKPYSTHNIHHGYLFVY